MPEPFLHELVGFADELHVAVLDAVVDHLHVVAGAVLAHPVAAGLAFGSLGADRLENVLHQRPRRGAAAGHHGRAEARAFLAAGDAGADVEQALALQVLGAADGVGEVRVAAVDDAGRRVRGAAGACSMKSSTGLPALTISMILRGRLRSFTISSIECAPMTLVRPLAASFRNSSTLDDGAVVRDHGVAVVVHVHDQVLAHDCQTDQGDICRLFHDLLQTVGARRRFRIRPVGHTLGEFRRASRKLGKKPSYSRCQSPL